MHDLRGLEITPLNGCEIPGATWCRVTVERTGAEYLLTVYYAGEGWPSEVRRALERIPDPWPTGHVVVARRLSPGALADLDLRDANWADEAGNVHIVVPPALVVIKRVVKPAGRSEPGFSWSRSAIAIAEHILEHPRRQYDIPGLSRALGWSASQLSNVLNGFVAKGWMSRSGPARGRGIRWEVADAGPLLDSWAAHVAQNRPGSVRGHRLLIDPLDVLRSVFAPRLSLKGGWWALSGWAALQIVAPFIDMVPALQIYLPRDRIDLEMEDIFRSCGVRPVKEGANVEVFTADVLFRTRRQEDLPIVNNVRLYADLLALGGRAVEAAEHVRETQLGF